MRLAVNFGYFTAGYTPADYLTVAKEADRLGYSTVWAAETYAADAPTLLAWLAGQTERIDVGTAIMQIPARSPAMTAMTAAGLDMLTGGRFRLGLGVSGPQVSEGWHGMRFGKPLNRTREYVDVVKIALARESVSYAGEHYQLPLPNGPGKAMRLTLHRVRDHIPIYLAALGPRNLELAGEIADGWLGVFVAPEYAGDLLSHLATGRASAVGTGTAASLAGFDVVASVPVAIGRDVPACADSVRGYAAMFVGGMGSRERNFYNRLAVRMGYGDAARRVQDLYLARKHREAAAAIPLEFVDRTALIGPVDRTADRLRDYAAAGITTLSATLIGDAARAVTTLRQLAEAMDTAGVGE